MSDPTEGRPLLHRADLATSGVDGRPAVRMVLVRRTDEQGFRFFTNYESHKARDLAAHPRAALLFYWDSPQSKVLPDRIRYRETTDGWVTERLAP